MPREKRDVFEGDRTRPWRAEEYATIEGWPIVYCVGSELAELRFHLPGGAVLTATAAHRAGLRVRLPRVLRREGPVNTEGAG
ncbi:MAG: hypothetical protein MUE84_15545 [Hyphomonas sp.]|jgi:hypothetical protein|nr:hypothetical protein [Hyphomonas sp.]